LVCYAEEDNRTVGAALAAGLRAHGFSLTAFRLWPSSGTVSYDSALYALNRSRVAVFVTADRPTAWRGALGLPETLMNVIAASTKIRPTILVSLGNPYLITRLPEVGSYIIGWRSNPIIEQAVARALAGAAPITGHLPISIPPNYPRGWGLQRQLP
jgi:hypothetical protein